MTGPAEAVCLVPCASRKRSARAPARDLYESALFRKMRAVVEELGSPWFILSARHGLVQPDQQLDPYDLALKDMRASERRSWAKRVIGQMESVLPPADRIVVFAGKTYREFLMAWLMGRSPVVETPLAHLAIGRQQQYLVAWLAALRRGDATRPPTMREQGKRTSSEPAPEPPGQRRLLARGGMDGRSRYRPLHDFLATRSEQVVELTFAEVDRLLGGLPRSAYAHRPWWANHRNSPQARAWLDAGRQVSIDWAARIVRFLERESA